METFKKELVLSRAVGLLNQYNGSLIAALERLYGGDNGRTLGIALQTREYWKHLHNQKKFFDELMLERGLDSSNANWWQNITRSIVLEKEGGASILNNYSSVYHALQTLYPQHANQVGKKERGYWHKTSNQRNLSRFDRIRIEHRHLQSRRLEVNQENRYH